MLRFAVYLVRVHNKKNLRTIYTNTEIPIIQKHFYINTRTLCVGLGQPYETYGPLECCDGKIFIVYKLNNEFIGNFFLSLLPI